MKKTWKRFSLALLLVCLCLCAVTVSAFAAGSCVVTSGDTARAGGTVNVTVSLGAENLYGFEGTLTYSDNLTLKGSGITQNVGGKWDVSYNKGTVVGADLALTNPLNTRTTVFTATFAVSSSASVGDTVFVKFSNIKGTDITQDLSIDGDTWERQVAAAPSGDNNLASLSCGNATLSPAFSKNTTNYTCTVPYDVTALDLKYSRSDGNAKAAVSGNELEVGENTVTITVTAANGSAKYYTISVTREKDPNYKPSTNADLSELTIEGTTLSPAFSPSVTEYVAYVPFETQEVVLHGVPADEKALGTSDKTVTLSQEGDNTATLTCTAEDGVTTQTYTVHIYRMPAYTGGNLLVEITDPDAVLEEPEIPTAAVPLKIKLPLVGEASTLLVGGIALGLVMILLFLLGLLIGRSGQEDDEYEEVPERKVALEDLDKVRPMPEAVYELTPPAAKPEEPKNGSVIPVPAKKPMEKEEEIPVQLREEQAADKAAEAMTLDELLDDIRNL